MNPVMDQIYKTRYRAYEELFTEEEKVAMNGIFRDEFDDMPGTVYFTSNNVSSIRLSTMPPFMAVKFFGWSPEPDHFEASRLCIDPSVTDATQRIRLIQKLFSQVVRRSWDKVVLSQAVPKLTEVYKTTMGFEPVEGFEPKIIFPGKEPVTLLKLDLRLPEKQSIATRVFGEGVRR